MQGSILPCTHHLVSSCTGWQWAGIRRQPLSHRDQRSRDREMASLLLCIPRKQIYQQQKTPTQHFPVHCQWPQVGGYFQHHWQVDRLWVCSAHFDKLTPCMLLVMHKSLTAFVLRYHRHWCICVLYHYCTIAFQSHFVLVPMWVQFGLWLVPEGKIWLIILPTQLRGIICIFGYIV